MKEKVGLSKDLNFNSVYLIISFNIMQIDVLKLIFFINDYSKPY